MGFRYSAEGATDVGPTREHNEDSFQVVPPYNLFMVADGMGGHNAGDVASRIAVDSVATFFRSTESEDATWPFHFDANLSYEENRIIGGIQIANRSIYHQSAQVSGQEGMGTTIVALCFSKSDPVAYLGHVGDSRCYVVRDGQVRQLTRDHSLYSDFVQAMPELSEEKKQAIPKNIITRALGMQSYVEVELTRFDVVDGDTFVLCSDGMSGAIPDAEIGALTAAAGDDLAAACRALVERAKTNGGDDNITVVVVRARREEGESPEGGGRDAAARADAGAEAAPESKEKGET